MAVVGEKDDKSSIAKTSLPLSSKAADLAAIAAATINNDSLLAALSPAADDTAKTGIAAESTDHVVGGKRVAIIGYGHLGIRCIFLF